MIASLAARAVAVYYGNSFGIIDQHFASRHSVGLNLLVKVFVLCATPENGPRLSDKKVSSYCSTHSSLDTGARNVKG